MNKNQQIIIQNFGQDYKIDDSTHDLRYQCPRCKELGKHFDDYKLYVSYDNLIFHCFRCDWRGKLSVEEYLEEGTTSKLLTTLAAFLPKAETFEDTEAEPVVFKIPAIIPNQDDPAVKYLESRGVSYEDVLRYNMRVATLEDPYKFLGRVVIPNKVLAKQWTDMYSARAYIRLEPKYLNPKNSPRAKTVFNLHNIEDNCEQIIINEGVLTSIVAGPDSVATYGKAVTDEQITQILEKKPKRIYVSLDNDANPAQQIYKDPTEYKVAELVEKLLNRTRAEIYLVQMPPGKDAVDVGRTLYRDHFIKNALRIRNINEYRLVQL